MVPKFKPLKTAYRNLSSNKEVSLVTIGTIAAAFSILGLFLVVFENLNSHLATWNKQVQLLVYLKDDISQRERQNLERTIKKNSEVVSLDYVSRSQAWKNFINTFSESSEILQSLEFNPLPASYKIQFKESPERVDKIRRFANVLKDQTGVDSIDYGEKWISRFETFMVFLRVFLLAVGGLLSLGLILIISNTIKLSVYSRRDEIELMSLIGATQNFIRLPFLLEGMLQGAAGSLLSFVVVKLIHVYMKFQFKGSLESITRGIDIQFLSLPYGLGLFLTSLIIGWCGSYISIYQYLHNEGAA